MSTPTSPYSYPPPRTFGCGGSIKTVMGRDYFVRMLVVSRLDAHGARVSRELLERVCASLADVRLGSKFRAAVDAAIMRECPVVGERNPISRAWLESVDA